MIHDRAVSRFADPRQSAIAGALSRRKFIQAGAAAGGGLMLSLRLPLTSGEAEAAGGRCVFTCEWNPFARRTYAANFGETHPIAGDIREMVADEIPGHDLLLAGFPCQPFSIAGAASRGHCGQHRGPSHRLAKPHGPSTRARGASG